MGEKYSQLPVKNMADESLGNGVIEQMNNAQSAESSFVEWIKVRAEDGIRTRDFQLGKLTLYQLSYFRRSLKINLLFFMPFIGLH